MFYIESDNESPTVEIDTLKSSILYFRKIVTNKTIENSSTLEIDLFANITTLDTWAAFVAQLNSPVPTNPTLIIIDFDILLHQDISIPEFISMVSNIHRFSKNTKKMRLAVSVQKACPLNLVRELQETDVLGIVPDIEDFDYQDQLLAFNDLLKLKSHWPKIIIKQLAGNKSNKKTASSEIALTMRQHQILTLIGNRGLSNKSIAALLKISESTVKIHISAIMRAYGVRNRTQLALASTSSLKA